MPYDPTVPQGLPSPASQVSAVRTNFSQFGTIFSNNHTALNASNQGSHEAITLTLQSADPGVTQNEAILYSKNASSHAGTQPQLFVQIPDFLPTALDPSDPGNPGMQLTYNSVNTAGSQYQSFLVGGYILYFGTVSATGTITLSPAPTKILTAIAQANNRKLVALVPFDVNTTIISNSQFSINSQQATGVFTFTWLVIAQA